MAQTVISDIINPEVLADQVSAKFPDYLVFGQFPGIDVDDTLMKPGGTKVKMPFFKRIGSFGSMTEGTPLVPGKIDTGSEEAIVVRAGLAIQILDTAELVSLPSPMNEAVAQISRRAAEYLDSTLVTAAEKTPNYLDYSQTGAGTMDDVAILGGLAKLGDNYQRILANGALIMHSKPYMDLQALGKVQNAYQGNFDNLKTGVVGMFLGLPIYLSDRVTTATVSSATVYNSYIVGPGALQLMYQRNLLIEFDRDVLLQANVAVATIHHATHLNGWDDTSNTQAAQDAKSILAVKVRTK